MKARADHATLVELAARLERANEQDNNAARGDMRAERRSPRAAVARLPQSRANGHAAAYLGAGAVVLGLLCLILVGQLAL